MRQRMGGKNTSRISIIGSGLGGCFLAILLAKKGYSVDIYERFTKAQTTDANTKRSYSLTLYGYGINILKENGLWKDIKPHLIRLEGSYTQLTKKTKSIFTPVNNEEMSYYCISRTQLLTILLEKISKIPHIKIHYATNIVAIDKHDRYMVIENLKTRKFSKIKPDVIFGADGANSTVRSFMQYGVENAHSQEYANWTYKQFPISKKWVEKFGLNKQAAYTWSRKNACIAAFPNKNGSLAALLILPKGKYGYDSLTSRTAVHKRIEQEFPTFLPMASDIATALLKNPEGNYVTIHTNPWYYKDYIAIIGDAAHGFYPFMGQGASAAFGDSIQIVKLLDTHGPKWETIFAEYQAARKKNMDTLGDLSKIELQRYLRNKRADYNTIYNKLESLAHRFFPLIIKAPVNESVPHDPEKTAYYAEAHRKQRSRARFIGIPLSVFLATQIIALTEAFANGKKLLKK